MKLISKIINISGVLSGILISVITIALILEVIMRNGFNSPITGVNEICVFMYISAVYFGFSYTQKHRGHITVDLVYDRLGDKAKVVIDRVVYVICTALFVLFSGCNWQRFVESYVKKELYYGGKTMPVYVLRFAIAVGGTLMAIQLLMDTINMFKSRKKNVEEVTTDSLEGGETE